MKINKNKKYICFDFRDRDTHAMTKKKQQNTAKLSKLKTELSALRKFKRQVRFEMKCLLMFLLISSQNYLNSSFLK